jgi:hypothetical protein
LLSKVAYSRLVVRLRGTLSRLIVLYGIEMLMGVGILYLNYWAWTLHRVTLIITLVQYAKQMDNCNRLGRLLRDYNSH